MFCPAFYTQWALSLTIVWSASVYQQHDFLDLKNLRHPHLIVIPTHSHLRHTPKLFLCCQPCLPVDSDNNIVFEFSTDIFIFSGNIGRSMFPNFWIKCVLLVFGNCLSDTVPIPMFSRHNFDGNLEQTAIFSSSFMEG